MEVGLTNAEQKKLAYYQEFDNQHEALRGQIRTVQAALDLEDAKQDVILANKMKKRK